MRSLILVLLLTACIIGTTMDSVSANPMPEAKPEPMPAIQIQQGDIDGCGDGCAESGEGDGNY